MSDVTLNHFFPFHVTTVPLVLLGLVMVYTITSHEMGSNNPDDIETRVKKSECGIPLDSIPPHLYYLVCDIVDVTVFLSAPSAIVSFVPGADGYFPEVNNLILADSLRMLPHIVPVWCFMPLYLMLCVTTSDFPP